MQYIIVMQKLSFSFNPSAAWFAILAGMLLLAGNASAQQLDFDEVTVIAPYEPTISDAFKINFNPAIEDTMNVDIVFNYSINPVQIPVKFNMEPLSPARMRGEPLAKLYKGYVKAGMGNYATPYAEVFYNTLRSNEYHYGVHAKHISSGGGIDDYGYSGYSENSINLDGKRFLRNHTLDLGLGYERNVVHFYGFKPEDFDGPDPVDEKKDYRQRFSFISPSVAFTSNYLDSTKLQHNIKLDYYYLSDIYDAAEHRLGFETNLQKTLREDPMGFAEKQTFHLDLRADYFNSRTLADTAHTALVRIEPSLSATFKDFNFNVGINTTIQADTVSNIRFYPLAGAEVTLINNVLFAYATLSGELTKHNMRDLTLTNPFMQTSVPYAFMNRKSEIRGGFKGSISSFASYNVSISNSSIDNYPFFVTDFDTPLNNRFLLIYDDIRLFNFRTELFSNVGERLKVRFASDYYQYTLDNELQPWHEPTVKLSLNLSYNIQDKIILNADAFARNSIYAKTFDRFQPEVVEPVKIHGFHVDVNLGVEYRYTKILSVFLNLNNLQNQPLERWYNYPSQRFNVLGGVTYAF
ncbi:MAG: hypothetical protein ACOCX0_05180 [Bacteroidota bacterium]